MGKPRGWYEHAEALLSGRVRGGGGAPIFGGPKWAGEERYDIDAKAAGPAGDGEMMAMLQTLLAGRRRRIQPVLAQLPRPRTGFERAEAEVHRSHAGRACGGDQLGAGVNRSQRS